MEENNTIQVISKSFKNLAENNSFANILQFLMQFLIVLLLFFMIYFLVHIGNQYIAKEKRINIGKKQILYFILSFILLIIVIVLFQAGNLMYEILSPFIFAIILAYTFNPLVSYIETKGVKRIWAVFIVYFAIAALIFIFSTTLLPKMVNEVKKLLESLPQLGNDSYGYIYNKYVKYNKNIENLPPELSGVKDLLKFDGKKLEGIVMKVLSSVTNTMLSIISKLVNIVLTPILAFYFLKDAEKFKNMLILSIPKAVRKETIAVAKDMDQVLGGFIRGQLIVAGIVGILTTIALLFLKVEFAAIVGLVAGIANIIPYFGPIVGIIPGVIFASLGGLNKVIWVIITFTAIQQIESAVISPKIISDKVGVHPVVVILSLIIAGKFFGLIGLLLAVPTAGIIKVLGKHFINYIAKF